jgi:hypothetical protein
MGPFSPDLKTRVKQLEQLVADLVAEKKKSATSFQGVKLRPADPSKYAGGNKDVIKDWLATMVQWLGSGMCVTLDEIRCLSARRVRKPRLAFQQT